MLALLVCSTLAVRARDDPQSDAPTAAGEVRKIDENQCIADGISPRKSTRELSFDATFNKTGGLIEFLIVTGKGKVHESFFSCAIRSTDLQLFPKTSMAEKHKTFRINP